LTYAEALAYATTLNNAGFAGYTDWRVPSIKELYSLIDFRGEDPSSYMGTDSSGLTPFIDTDYFDFSYGDLSANERLIDAQYASSNLYIDTVDGELLFGVNFADGRIKGYQLVLQGNDKTFFVMCVRSDVSYGINVFTDQGDGTIADSATGLMWAQDDNGEGLIWSDALQYVQDMNGSNYLGYNDWRLPNIKELQSIVDYTRSPGITGSAAIDALFNATPITNEEGILDWGYYWSTTTHADWQGHGSAATYIPFGRGLGCDTNFFVWIDVHGAGCQRSDPKIGDPADYPTGFGPQGDAIRIYNFVRPVRDTTESIDPDLDGDGLPDWWETQYYGDSTNANPSAICSNGVNTVEEAYIAGLNPTNAQSWFLPSSVRCLPSSAGIASPAACMPSIGRPI